MIFEGAVLKIDEKKLQDITRNINGASANVNQIAIRINTATITFQKRNASIVKRFNKNNEDSVLKEKS